MANLEPVTQNADTTIVQGALDVDDVGFEKAIHAISGFEKECSTAEIDLLTYHERNAGRLVVDPECAIVLFLWCTMARMKVVQGSKDRVRREHCEEVEIVK